MFKRVTLLLLSLVLLTLVSACSGAASSNRTPTTGQPDHTTPALTAHGNIEEYPLPQLKSGLMRPAIDSKGRVWFGEMGNNALASFDPQAQKFQQMKPPNGQAGIMGVVVASDDTIWYAEQSANYIGHYDPHKGTYQTYNLPLVKLADHNNKNSVLSLPSAPNDLVFDAAGNLWFTEMNADSIGKLDTKTGHITQYLVSTQQTVQKYNPYGITVDKQGIVWFSEASSSNLGRLDPATGQMRFFAIPGSTNPLMEVASDAHGLIWATTFNNATLLTFDPQKQIFYSYLAPDADGGISGIYGLTITPQQEVWVTIPASNVVARFDTNAKRFLYYHIPTSNSIPLGVAYAANHTIWFTESAGDRIGRLMP